MIKLTKASILQIQFAESSGLSCLETEKEVHLGMRKKTLLQYSCQFETDHVTQQPKEIYQMTCRGPNMMLWIFPWFYPKISACFSLCKLWLVPSVQIETSKDIDARHPAHMC